MGERRYLKWITNVDRRRHYHRTEEGDIVRFSVQYESYIKGKWHPIVRYDTAHGYAHRDLYHPDGIQEKTPLPLLNYKDVLTYAAYDIDINWEKYKNKYLREMEEEN